MWLPSALAEICTGSGPAPVVPVSVALAMSSRETVPVLGWVIQPTPGAGTPRSAQETVPLLGWLIQPTPGAEAPEPNAPPLSGMCATTWGGVGADERAVTCAVPLSRVLAEAVIVASPGATAVTRPADETVATVGALDDHVKAAFF